MHGRLVSAGRRPATIAGAANLAKADAGVPRAYALGPGADLSVRADVQRMRGVAIDGLLMPLISWPLPCSSGLSRIPRTAAAWASASTCRLEA